MSWIVIFGILAAGGAWLYYGTDKETITQGKEKITQSKEKISTSTKHLSEKLKLNRLRKTPAKAEQPFKEWMSTAPLDKRKSLYQGLPQAAAEATRWFNSLSEEEAEAFTGQLSAFCANLGFKLDWLVDPRVEDQLKQAVEEAVTLYCLGYWNAVQVQDDVKVFSALQNWWADPTSKKNNELTQKLFAAAVAQSLIIAPPATLILASDISREAHVMESLRYFAQQDKQRFFTLFKETLASMNSLPEAVAETSSKLEEAASQAEPVTA
jgi:hypothetical protein